MVSETLTWTNLNCSSNLQHLYWKVGSALSVTSKSFFRTGINSELGLLGIVRPDSQPVH